ncbi:MAG: phosphohistidine phosphatase SixA [Chamaesiphon sp.]|nr:phosphohistidine phosphatase SixA [Chamaesiphon sp.]
MYLYLIRHGIAADPDPLVPNSIFSDEIRPLTKVGRKKITQVAAKLQKLELTFDLMITSPLIRARQTAAILIDSQISPKLEVSQDLKPSGNLPNWLIAWNARGTSRDIASLALVGHEPNLSEWAELLVFGKVCHKLILKKGGIVGLKFPDHQVGIEMAQLHCVIPSKYLS